MRILGIPLGDDKDPSSRFRFFQYLSLLEKQGHDIKIIYLRKSQKKVDFLKDLWAFIRECIYSDFIWVQRRLLPIYLLRFVRLFRKKIVFDFDDSIHITDTLNKSKGLIRLNKVIHDADRVIVGNEYLKKQFYKYKNKIVVIPTPAICDNSSFCSKKVAIQKRKIIIGWIGTKHNIKYLRKVEKPLIRLRRKYGSMITILVCSDGVYDHPILKPVSLNWSFESEREALENIDIGIMPLFDDEWTRGKCGFKILLYMSNCIPCIASPVGINSRIIDHGANGFLCNSENEWYAAFVDLIEYPNKRIIIGQSGYDFVKEHYSTDVISKKVLKLFYEVISGRKGAGENDK